MIGLLLLLPVTQSLRIGYLTTSSENERTVLQKCLPKKRFELITLPACQNFSGIENSAILHYNHNVDIIVADGCDEEFDTLSKLAHRWNKLFVTFGHTILLSPDPTTIIFAPENPLGFASAIASLCEHAIWGQIGFFIDRAVAPDSERIYKAFEKLEESTKNVTISVVVDGTEGNWEEMVAGKTRILFVLARPSSIEHIFSEFYSKIQSPADYIVIFVDIYRIPSIQFYSEMSRILQELNVKARFLKNMSSVHFDKHIVREFAFANRLKVQSSLENHLLLCDLFPTLFSKNNSSGDQIENWNKPIQRAGLSGPILVSEGVRYAYVKLYAQVNGKPTEIAEINPVAVEVGAIHKINGSAHLFNILLSLPPAIPECGFTGELCPVGHVFLIAGVIVCIISIPLGIAFYLQRKEDELIRMPWRVAHENLAFKHENENPGYRRISAYSDSNSLTGDDDPVARKFAYVGNSKVTAQHFHQKKAISFSRTQMEKLNQLKNLNNSNVNPFIGITFNQNAELVVLWSYCVRGSLDDVCFGSGKRLGRNFQSTFLKHILHGLKYIHNSPVKVHGALFLTNCVVDSYWVVRLTDFGVNSILKTKMDSKDLVSNVPIQFDYMSKIHYSDYQPTQTKIIPQKADLPLFRSEDKLPYFQVRLEKKFLQLPPEYLLVLKEAKDFFSIIPTVEGDIYQFGMLMYQILFYRRPFRERREENEELIDLICDSERKVAMRPIVVDSNEFNMRLLSIMQQCWLHRVENRPPLFKIIDAVAREFGHSAKGTLIDQMITMIDEYSANLEEIVSERTKALEEQNEKTEALLYRLMPRQIANSLRDGIPVRPQLHVAVSILVSDVCKFTALCESCIPEHIIDILQLLYSSLDHIISRFNCFKVENVGDAYLLVSGIPDFPNHGHLAEVCKLALEFQMFIKTFKVPHKPDFNLQIKMGISCGAIASGILGSLSPRFCIFGDTVNMACRMASTSLPDKIQITEGSNNYLATKYPDFITEERGAIEIKGKGSCVTYWLLGEKPPLKPKRSDEIFLDVVEAVMPKSGRSLRSWKHSARSNR